MSEYTRWYRAGSVSGSAGSNTVTGRNTFWDTAGINTGDILKLNGQDYEILSVNSNTQLTIAGTLANTASNSAYAIVRNFTATTNAKMAAQVSGLVSVYAKFLNTQTATLSGKSAYDVACANGYVGTEAQWLEGLKAAGEWQTLDTRTAHIKESMECPAHIRAGAHNSIMRGKCLGTSITAAQWASIAAGTFDDMFLADYWDIGGVRHRIVHFDYMFNLNGLTGTNDPNGDPYYPYNTLNALTRYPHHLVLMPDVGFGHEDVNSTEDAGKAYAVSTYRKEKRKEIIAQLEEMFGADHLMYWTEELVSALGPYNGDADDYVPSARALYSCQAELPSVFQLAGVQPSMLNGSTWAGGRGDVTLYGGQFALMRLCSAFIRPVDFVNGINGYYVGVHPLTRDVRNAGPGRATYFRWNAGGPVSFGTPCLRPFYVIK